MELKLSRRSYLALLASPLVAGPLSAFSASIDKPINIVVGLSPGGSADTLARIVATKWAERRQQAVTVENRAGASSTIAAAHVSRLAPDGTTLLLAVGNHTIAPALLKIPYDPIQDFAPVGMVAVFPNIVVVHPSVPVHTVAQLIEHAKQNPGALTFSSAGLASINRMAAELFQTQVGVNMTHVPYKGSGQAITDLLAGRIHVAFDQASSVLPHILSGRLRALAITTSNRLKELPDVPTLAESGLTDYYVASWNGLLAPAGTPKDILDYLSNEVREVLAEPDVRAALAKAGAEPVGGSPEELKKFLQNDLATWADIVRKQNIKADE